MNYEILLKEHQLKVTPQRIGILSLMSEAGHITVDNLFSSIKKQFYSISLATLYKNINAMLKKSLITEVKVPEMKTHYEITKTPHAHLICSKCGEHKDILYNIENLSKSIASENSYEVDKASLIILGLCPKCK